MCLFIDGALKKVRVLNLVKESEVWPLLWLKYADNAVLIVGNEGTLGVMASGRRKFDVK